MGRARQTGMVADAASRGTCTPATFQRGKAARHLTCLAPARASTAAFHI